MIVGTVQDYSLTELAAKIKARASSHEVVAYIDGAMYVHVNGLQSGKGACHSYEPLGLVGVYRAKYAGTGVSISDIVGDLEATIAERRAAA